MIPTLHPQVIVVGKFTAIQINETNLYVTDVYRLYLSKYSSSNYGDKREMTIVKIDLQIECICNHAQLSNTIILYG